MNTLSLAHELEKSACRTEPEIETSETIRAAREVLLQGLELLFQLSDQTYSHASFTTGMSIGQHYGQVIQHFRSLLQGCRAGEIRYDACEPDVRLQSDVAYASIATCDVLRALKRYSAQMFDRQCYVSGRQPDGPNGKQNFASTLRLELAYCTANAVQQYAILRGICEELGIDPLTGFRSAVNESWACPLHMEQLIGIVEPCIEMLIESCNTSAAVEILSGEILREVRSMDDSYRINLAKTELREAYDAGDVDRLIAVFSSVGFTDMSEGGPTKYGSEAVAGFHNEASKLVAEYKVTMTPIINSIVVLGDVAYDYGCHEFTLRPKNGGESILKRQRYFELWNKDAAGNWKISLHINNVDVKEEQNGCSSHWFLSEEHSIASV